MAHFYTPAVYIVQCAVLHSIKASLIRERLWRLRIGVICEKPTYDRNHRSVYCFTDTRLRPEAVLR